MMRLAKLALFLGIGALTVGSAAAQRPGGGGRGGNVSGMLLENRQLQEELKLDKDQIDKIKAAIDKAVADNLKPEQAKRLEQIQNQLAGYRMYTRDKVQAALKLSDEQKDKIKTIIEETDKKGREAAEAAAGDFRGLREKMQTLRKEATESIEKTLTDTQKTTVKELTGEKFEFQFGRPGGGGGGRPGGGDRRPGGGRPGGGDRRPGGDRPASDSKPEKKDG
jgi:Spy/CpxP family protein refolding chaperone